MKSVSSELGIGRGRFRKAVRSIILSKYGEKNCFKKAKEELGDECIYCGDKNQKLQPDHLIREEQGGLSVIGNILPSCPTCNSERQKQEWQVFVNTCSRIKNGKETIKRIEEYIEKHKTGKQYHWSKRDEKILDDLDVILFALCEGIRKKLGMEQEKDIKFINQDQMFQGILDIVEKYKK